MVDLTDHTYVLEELKKAQDADHDNREKAREAHNFVDKRDGQWEPDWITRTSGKPRYTFDKVNPIIDQISGEMEQMDFVATVQPAGGQATKEIAETYEGLIRNIQNISNASHVYNSAGRLMVTSGLDGWEVIQAHVDDDSFEQDLLVKKVHNFIDRVWYGPSEEQDKSDAMMAWKMMAMDTETYKEKYPEGSGQSISSDDSSQTYFHKRESVIVGVFYFIKETERDLVLMSNRSTYEDNEDFRKLTDELTDLGVTEVDRRKRKKRTVWTRHLDGDAWLAEEEETVFQWIPLIPTFANYKVFENKVLYWGVVEKLLDPQRVLNYSKSREIEEGAFSPRAKYWGTEEQRSGHDDTIDTLNVNANPWQDYNHVDGVPPPFMQGGAQINPGLNTLSSDMFALIDTTANQFHANRGEGFGNQSGIAIKRLQDKGDTSNIKYVSSQEVAICHTERILIKAIPRIYPPGRQVRLLNEDNSFEMVTIGERMLDQESGEEIVLHDLSEGTYDVTCSAGPAFKNRQDETVSAIVEIAQVDPSVITMGADILLNNVTAPGMKLLAERKREQLLTAGAIPLSQMTEEEKQQAAARQDEQQNQTSLEQTIAQTQLLAEQRGIMAEQNKAQELQLKAASKGADLQGEREERDIKIAETRSDIGNTQFNQFMDLQDNDRKERKQQMDELTATIKGLVDLQTAAQGPVIGPGLPQNVKEQSDRVTIEQTQ